MVLLEGELVNMGYQSIVISRNRITGGQSILMRSRVGSADHEYRFMVQRGTADVYLD
jgi:hypothetical protein